MARAEEDIRLPDAEQRSFFADYMDIFAVDRGAMATLESRAFKVSSVDEFIACAGAGDLDLLKKVVATNNMYDIKKAATVDGWTCLHFAVHNQCVDILRWLIEQGCSLNGNGQDRTLLMDAVQYGHETVVKLLLEKGANVKDTDAEGWTAMGLARRGIIHEDKDKAKRIVGMLKQYNAPMSDL